MVHTLMAVHPKFLKKIKKAAVDKNTSIINLTKVLAESENDIICIKDWKYRKKKNEFSFGL